MPQNENLPAKWRSALGPEWERIHKTYLHVLGNLTLTGYNSEYSDRPFLEKRDLENGFAQSPLRLNQGLRSIENWNEEAIQQRGQQLAAMAIKVWDSPKLDATILASYRPKATTAGYTIEDQHYLLNGTVRNLFEAFRKEVLALDPCVIEEFLKLYVAYKAETNFVDVVPQSRQLRLSLNMPFPELNDPKGICKDVTNIGRWGNGNIEVKLSSVAEIPYILGLVRQAFERQMGSGSEE